KDISSTAFTYPATFLTKNPFLMGKNFFKFLTSRTTSFSFIISPPISSLIYRIILPEDYYSSKPFSEILK
ncbi:MAG: hypothetical protein J7L34_05010, partial [Thermotogaceae bacterium]|nr:hypothetical protein [Thermotogaceae bacterium]